jgi:2-keto-4-pentenoate hydratase/2-oxohepta-3-ene-1,7-dioic acid hydratase in catechol pathway
MRQVSFETQTVTPSKIVCVGRNYIEHIRELDNALPQQAVIFLKPNSAIAEEVHAADEGTLHYEGEICFIIEAGQLAGVGFGLDITNRTLQSQLKAAGLPWERAKAFDRSAVFSEFRRLNGSMQELRIELDINGNPVQRGEYAQMLYKPGQILEEIMRFMTLEDGDIMMTGTPEGVGPIVRGDQYTGRIMQGGTLLIEHSWTVR